MNCRVSQTSQLPAPCLPQKSGISRCVVKWSCRNILLQDKHPNSDLRQIKGSPCTDASFQIPAAIVQAFQLRPASSWWLPKALLDMQMRHSSGISSDEDLGMRCCLAVTMKDFFFCSCWKLAECAWESKHWESKVLRSWQHSQLTAQQLACSVKPLWGAERSRQAASRDCCLLCCTSLPFILQPPGQSHRLKLSACLIVISLTS